MNDRDLAGLIASRICHDLISPVGAIGNGLELLEMSPGAAREEAALIRQSADAATASLKFMRIAFGAPGFEDLMAQTDVARILTAYFNQGRRTAQWEPSGEGMTRADAQVLYLAALTLADTAPIGGALRVEAMAGDPLAISMVIHSTRIQPLVPLATPAPRDAHRVLFEKLTDEHHIAANWDVTSAEEIGLKEGYARLTLRAH